MCENIILFITTINHPRHNFYVKIKKLITFSIPKYSCYIFVFYFLFIEDEKNGSSFIENSSWFFTKMVRLIDFKLIFIQVTFDQEIIRERKHYHEKTNVEIFGKSLIRVCQSRSGRIVLQKFYLQEKTFSNVGSFNSSLERIRIN